MPSRRSRGKDATGRQPRQRELLLSHDRDYATVDGGDGEPKLPPQYSLDQPSDVEPADMERRTALSRKLNKLASQHKWTPMQRRRLRGRIRQAETATHPAIALERALPKRPTAEETASAELDPNKAVHIPDLQTILDTMALPTMEQYPKASKDLFTPKGGSAAIHNICQKAKTSFQAHIEFPRKDDKQTSWICRVHLEIPNVFSEAVYGMGADKQAAKHAAWLHVVSKMHTSGALKTLLASSSKRREEQNVPASRSDCIEADRLHLHDVAHWLKNLELPTKGGYPTAPSDLFEASRIQNAIYGQCAQLQIKMQADIGLSVWPQQKNPNVHVCNIRLNLSEICDETGFGEGLSKQAAKHAAWLHIAGKLHSSGILTRLFHSTKPPGSATWDFVDENGSSIGLDDIDKETLREEKDAKTDIYNYAARFGLVPVFEHSVVQPRAPRARLGRTPRKPRAIVRATVNLSEKGIRTSGTGKDLRTAEIAAALAFKRKAEKQHVSNVDCHVQDYPAGFQVLNTETAKYFFDFLQDIKRQMQIEIEDENSNQAGINLNTARITLNGQFSGRAVTMESKKQAILVAYLTAAVEVAKAEPDLLPEFEQRLNEGKGKVLKPAPAIDLPVDIGTLHVMRTALLEAKQAGLPDNRELLSATEGTTQSPRGRRKMALKQSEMEAASKRLLRRQQAFGENLELEDLRSRKSSLPMNQKREQVLDMVRSHPYSIVIGATGSGKTTQVPQILLENFILKGLGGTCNIVCTQPRRIAATSVARRVAEERNEPLQQSVGYHVRFDVRLPRPGGSITYCTTGVLLEQLKHDPDSVLDQTSHILIDEVHERDLNIDFTMVLLKRACAARCASGKTVPKVILMSATLDAELFANYFTEMDGNGQKLPCPSLSVPGRTYPVREKYLDSIMHELQGYGSKLNAVLDADKSSQEYLKAERSYASQTGSQSAASKSTIIDWKQRQPLLDVDHGNRAEQEREEGLVPVALLAATIAHICKTTTDGAILAFLPGLDEILRTRRLLQDGRIFGIDFSDASKFKICPLHSAVPKEEQDQIFQTTAAGCRKVILSTNIAETSVTVTDVKYVVDTGKLRENRYDQLKRISKLQCVWVSNSNVRQRAGRAGRVSNGNYYALFSQERHDSFKAVGLPELLRSDLQRTCLGIKQRFADESVESFLAEAIEPPPSRAVRSAVSDLKAIEAFTEEEKLTDLGYLLGRLPIHPMLGKMIVMGVIFRCLSPMLIFGAAAEERSLFISPITVGGRAAATTARRSYANGQASDHMAVLNAFQEIRNLRDQNGINTAFDSARESYIHVGAFRNIDQTAQQILQILVESGLIPDASQDDCTTGHYGPVSLNQNSDNPSLIKSLLLAGLHPNLGAKRAKGGRLYRTPHEQTVVMHPTSLNDEPKRRDKNAAGTLFTYSTLSQSNDGASLFMRDTTMVDPLMAILFGGRLNMTKFNCLEMDGWLPFFVQANDRVFATKLILEFRKALDRVLNGAFRSLADFDPYQTTSFLADDPIREKFAERIVETLGRTSDQLYI